MQHFLVLLATKMQKTHHWSDLRVPTITYMSKTRMDMQILKVSNKPISGENNQFFRENMNRYVFVN